MHGELTHLLSIIDIWMQGRTCLMLGVEDHRAAIVKTLVLEGASVHIRDRMVHCHNVLVIVVYSQQLSDVYCCRFHLHIASETSACCT